MPGTPLAQLPDAIGRLTAAAMTLALTPSETRRRELEDDGAAVQALMREATYGTVYVAELPDRHDGVYTFAHAEHRDLFARAATVAGGDDAIEYALPINDEDALRDLLLDERAPCGHCGGEVTLTLDGTWADEDRRGRCPSGTEHDPEADEHPAPAA